MYLCKALVIKYYRTKSWCCSALFMALQSNIVSQRRNRKKCTEGFDQGNISYVYTSYLSFVFFLHQSYLSTTGHSWDEQFSRNMRPLSFITNKKETSLLNHCSRSWTLTIILLEYIDFMQFFCIHVFFFSFFFFTNNFGSCLRTQRNSYHNSQWNSSMAPSPVWGWNERISLNLF